MLYVTTRNKTLHEDSKLKPKKRKEQKITPKSNMRERRKVIYQAFAVTYI